MHRYGVWVLVQIILLSETLWKQRKKIFSVWKLEAPVCISSILLIVQVSINKNLLMKTFYFGKVMPTVMVEGWWCFDVELN